VLLSNVPLLSSAPQSTVRLRLDSPASYSGRRPRPRSARLARQIVRLSAPIRAVTIKTIGNPKRALRHVRAVRPAALRESPRHQPRVLLQNPRTTITTARPRAPRAHQSPLRASLRGLPARRLEDPSPLPRGPRLAREITVPPRTATDRAIAADPTPRRNPPRLSPRVRTTTAMPALKDPSPLPQGPRLARETTVQPRTASVRAIAVDPTPRRNPPRLSPRVRTTTAMPAHEGLSPLPLHDPETTTTVGRTPAPVPTSVRTTPPSRLRTWLKGFPQTTARAAALPPIGPAVRIALMRMAETTTMVPVPPSSQTTGRSII